MIPVAGASHCRQAGTSRCWIFCTLTSHSPQISPRFPFMPDGSLVNLGRESKIQNQMKTCSGCCCWNLDDYGGVSTGAPDSKHLNQVALSQSPEWRFCYLCASRSVKKIGRRSNCWQQRLWGIDCVESVIQLCNWYACESPSTARLGWKILECVVEESLVSIGFRGEFVSK